MVETARCDPLVALALRITQFDTEWNCNSGHGGERDRADRRFGAGQHDQQQQPADGQAGQGAGGAAEEASPSAPAPEAQKAHAPDYKVVCGNRPEPFDVEK